MSLLGIGQSKCQEKKEFQFIYNQHHCERYFLYKQNSNYFSSQENNKTFLFQVGSRRDDWFTIRQRIFSFMRTTGLFYLMSWWAELRIALKRFALTPSRCDRRGFINHDVGTGSSFARRATLSAPPKALWPRVFYGSQFCGEQIHTSYGCGEQPPWPVVAHAHDL